MRTVLGLLLLLLTAACPGGGSGDDDDDGDDGGSADASPPLIDAGGPVGRACAIDLGDAGASAPTVVAAPSLDCPDRICAHIEGQPLGECTHECQTAAECAPAAEAACPGNFACAELTSVGPFAGRSFCVCSDYLGDG